MLFVLCCSAQDTVAASRRQQPCQRSRGMSSRARVYWKNTTLWIVGVELGLTAVTAQRLIEMTNDKVSWSRRKREKVFCTPKSVPKLTIILIARHCSNSRGPCLRRPPARIARHGHGRGQPSRGPQPEDDSGYEEIASVHSMQDWHSD